MPFDQGIHDKVKSEFIRHLPSGLVFYEQNRGRYESLPKDEAVPLWGELLTLAQEYHKLTPTSHIEKDDPWVAKGKLPTTDKKIKEIRAYRLDWEIDGDNFYDVIESYAYAVDFRERLNKT